MRAGIWGEEAPSFGPVSGPSVRRFRGLQTRSAPALLALAAGAPCAHRLCANGPGCKASQPPAVGMHTRVNWPVTRGDCSVPCLLRAHTPSSGTFSDLSFNACAGLRTPQKCAHFPLRRASLQTTGGPTVSPAPSDGMLSCSWDLRVCS